jgi:hypothetical protein
MLELPMEFPPPPGLVHPSKMECQSWRKWGWVKYLFFSRDSVVFHFPEPLEEELKF